MSKKIYCDKCGKLVLDMEKGRIKPFKAICKSCDKPTPPPELPDSFKDIFGGFSR